MEPVLEPIKVSSYSHCKAPNFKNNAQDIYNFSFFRFPKLLSRYKTWNANAKLENIAHHPTEYCYNHFQLCSERFEERMLSQEEQILDEHNCALVEKSNMVNVLGRQ
ncbi:hypothetical protein Trydic_g8495 [Trypoxylus dichotomus]